MGEAAERKKIVIDTDPGIDDAMAIFVALESPEIEVVGLTTIYGNVYTTLATRNALHLVSSFDRTGGPVGVPRFRNVLLDRPSALSPTEELAP